MSFRGAYRDRRVFVTGHTGFKGAWLTEWLLRLGARVTGYSLPAATTPSLFDELGLATRIERHVIGDVREAAPLEVALREAQPDFVFHLAAQPLVRESYRRPVDTYATNVIGTVHLLDALRRHDQPCAAVFVATDKCYENHEVGRAYVEEDALGGHDPYSSSKAAMEIAVSSWRRSFFTGHPVRIASVRAGNVVGGGDWAADRIVPDCIRSLQRGESIAVRRPDAVRPWQHVLEPLSGYLWLAACLAKPELTGRSASEVPAAAAELSTAFNFGPDDESNRTVRDVVETLLRHWPGRWEDASNPAAVHEATLLQLSISKARRLLGWSPVWQFPDTIIETVRWYRAVCDSAAGAPDITRNQIDAYCARALSQGLPWAQP